MRSPRGCGWRPEEQRWIIYARIDARALADVLDRQGANDSCSSSQLDRGDVIEAVRRALVNLTPRQRAVVTLRLLEGCSVRDSAIRLGVAEGTVKATLSQARRSLRATLTDHR